MPKYTQDDWDRFQGLLGTGLSGGAALRKLGIPRGSLGALNRRFNGSTPPAPKVEIEVEEGPRPGIGALAQELHEFTEQLLDLATSMSELTKHASGLALLDRTLGQLETKQHEARGLRRKLSEAESRLLARASVVHSTD
jgi:hypothetical protein